MDKLLLSVQYSTHSTHSTYCTQSHTIHVFPGTLHDMSREMDALTDELDMLQTDIAELSTGAMAEANLIMGYVRDVEAAASEATTISVQSQEVRIIIRG